MPPHNHNHHHHHHRDQWTIKRLTQIVDHAIGELGADSGLIRGFDPKTRTLKLIATGSSRIHLDATASVKVGEGISGYVALKKKNVVIGDVDGHPHLGSREFIRKHGIKSVIGAPIFVGRRLYGAFTFHSVRKKRFSSDHFKRLKDDILFVSVFLHYLSLLENALLYEKLEKNYAATVRALVLAVEAKDAYTRGHSERVTRLAVRLAKSLKLSEPAVRRLYWVGLLHDIGKIGVSEKVLNKPKTLNDFEFEEIKRHPIEGARMLEEIEQMKDIIPVIRHHHENYDGTGYPDKLKGSDVPIEARILAVCDMYDAFTSARPYRRPYPKVKALDRLKSFKGTRLDPKIVETFMALFGDSSL